MSLIEHTLPLAVAPKDKDKGDKGKGKGDKSKNPKEGPVRTQMMGEKPGDDLGYDPKIIPVEEIE